MATANKGATANVFLGQWVAGVPYAYAASIPTDYLNLITAKPMFMALPK